MTTRFAVGQEVEALVDAQGLTKGGLYTVVEIATENYGVFGTVVRYWLTEMGRGPGRIEVGNGHLVLRATAPARSAKARKAVRS